MNLDQVMEAERRYNGESITVLHDGRDYSYSILPARCAVFGCAWFKRYTGITQVVLGTPCYPTAIRMKVTSYEWQAWIEKST